jgi:hypothetical protein
MQRTEYLLLFGPQPIYLTREYVKRSPYCAVVCDGRQFDSRRAQYLFHNNSNRAGARGPLTLRQHGRREFKSADAGIDKCPCGWARVKTWPPWILISWRRHRQKCPCGWARVKTWPPWILTSWRRHRQMSLRLSTCYTWRPWILISWCKHRQMSLRLSTC